jgi:hypothetical protein
MKGFQLTSWVRLRVSSTLSPGGSNGGFLYHVAVGSSEALDGFPPI